MEVKKALSPIYILRTYTENGSDTVTGQSVLLLLLHMFMLVINKIWYMQYVTIKVTVLKHDLKTYM